MPSAAPEVLRLTDLVRPEPRDDEVRIRVRAAGVNPVDYKIRSGAFRRPGEQLPRMLGRDLSGVVDACGDKVEHRKEGAAVYAMFQLAKAKGAHVVTTVRGADLDFVRNLGADHAIDYE